VAAVLRDVTGATHWLISAAPTEEGGDPFLAAREALSALTPPRWVGYLSATSVYGDTAGKWVDEDSPVKPTADRGHRRVAAEQAWLDWGEGNQVATHVFRLGGIYGPGRCALDRVRAGHARIIEKPKKLFNRIHIDDIVRVLQASIARPRAGGIYNVIDDKPLPPEAVTLEAYRLLNEDPPAPIAWDDPSLSPSVRSFYEGNMRVRSTRLVNELGVALEHKDAIAGLNAIFEAEGS
jgi:nucleoside-diphosphate-sugar epimerase